VPERYFRFQRTSDPTFILPVLRHNAWDILSLVALAAHLAAVCDGADYPFQAGRAAIYAGDAEAAIRHFETALASNLGRAERLETLEHLARANATLARFEAAAAWWQALIDEPRSRRLAPYVELAKLSEHRLKDLPAAYMLVDTAVGLVERGLLRPGSHSGETSFTALYHRRERLAAALSRHAAKAPRANRKSKIANRESAP
jgi:tetratricopeptide (TPR) repeat protein